MKFDSNNFSKTVIIDNLVLPTEIWIYGGLYKLKLEDKQYFYSFERADENAYNKFFKTNGLIPPKAFKDFNYKKVVDAVSFVKYIKSGKNKLIIKQYKIALEKEKNKKLDYYKKSFLDSNLSNRDIEIKFKNLIYIRPYYSILNLLNKNIKWEDKGENNEK